MPSVIDSCRQPNPAIRFWFNFLIQSQRRFSQIGGNPIRATQFQFDGFTLVHKFREAAGKGLVQVESYGCVDSCIQNFYLTESMQRIQTRIGIVPRTGYQVCQRPAHDETKGMQYIFFGLFAAHGLILGRELPVFQHGLVDASLNIFLDDGWQQGLRR